MDKYYRNVPPEQLDQLVRFRADHIPKTVLLDGVTWEYLVSGDSFAQPLLLFTGALSTAESAWRTFSSLEQIGRYRLICPSYPGEIDTMRALADGCAQILTREGISATYVLGGSYGGMLAQVFTHRHPQRVTRLVLSHTYPPVASRARSVKPALRMFRILPMALLKKMLRSRMVGILPPDPAPELQLIAAQIHETIDTRLTRQAALSTFLRLMDFDLQNYTPADLSSWQGKTLILLAEDDRTTPEALRQKLANLYPDARLHLFEGSGHATAILESGEYIKVIEDFFEEK